MAIPGRLRFRPARTGRSPANGNSGFILGVAGATEPAIYNLQATFSGFVVAPAGTVVVNGATLTGGVISDRLIINGGGALHGGQ